jgi:hypothetical protein
MEHSPWETNSHSVHKRLPTFYATWRFITMKMAVFWDVTPCSLVDTDQCFRGSYCLHHHGGVTHHPDYGGSKLLWNGSQYLQGYTVQHPRRQPSSYSSLWELETHLLLCSQKSAVCNLQFTKHLISMCLNVQGSIPLFELIIINTVLVETYSRQKKSIRWRYYNCKLYSLW